MAGRTAGILLGGLILVGVGLLPLPGSGEPVDRIVAVVDVEPILASEVDEAVWLYRAQMGVSPTDTTGLSEFRHEVLEQLIDEKLLVAKAARDGISVGTKELAEGLDFAVEDMRRSFGSEGAFEAELAKEGLTLQGLKDRYRSTVRQQILARRVMEQQLRPKVRTGPDEVRAFYESHRDSIPPVPEQVRMVTALVGVKADPETRDAARRRAEVVLGRIRAGADFAQAAMEYSEAPEGKRGGDVGFFRKGDLAQVPELETLAFSLALGEAGGPVETPLGFHLLRKTEEADDRVRVSQILFRVVSSKEDTLRAAGVAADIRKELIEGRSGDEVREQHASDAAVTVEDLGPMAVTDFLPLYRDVLRDLPVGGTSDVLVVSEGFQVLRLTERLPAHDPTFEDIEGQLADLLARRKMEAAYREWVAELRGEIYIKVLE